jgi:hypothetical protein
MTCPTSSLTAALGLPVTVLLRREDAVASSAWKRLLWGRGEFVDGLLPICPLCKSYTRENILA